MNAAQHGARPANALRSQVRSQSTASGVPHPAITRITNAGRLSRTNSQASRSMHHQASRRIAGTIVSSSAPRTTAIKLSKHQSRAAYPFVMQPAAFHSLTSTISMNDENAARRNPQLIASTHQDKPQSKPDQSRPQVVKSSHAESRRHVRERNKEYFQTRIWEPALKRDLQSSYRLIRALEEEAARNREAELRNFDSEKAKENIRKALDKLENQSTGQKFESVTKPKVHRKYAEQGKNLRNSTKIVNRNSRVTQSSSKAKAKAKKDKSDEFQIMVLYSSSPLADAESLAVAHSKENNRLPHYRLRQNHYGQPEPSSESSQNKRSHKGDNGHKVGCWPF